MTEPCPCWLDLWSTKVHTSHPLYIGAVSEPSCAAEEGNETSTHSAKTGLASGGKPANDKDAPVLMISPC